MDDDLVVWVILVPIFLLAWPIFGSFHSPTSGEHTGYVTAIENTGLIFHTWTVYFKTNTESSQEDRYCVIDTNILDQLKYYQKESLKVTVKYDNGFFVPFWQCKSKDSSVIKETI